MITNKELEESLLKLPLHILRDVAMNRIKVQTGKWSGYCFIPEKDTEEFIKTREYDFDILNIKPEYLEV